MSKSKKNRKSVEKMKKAVQKSAKSSGKQVEKQQKTCARPVEKFPEKVEKVQENVNKTVENNVQNLEKSAKNPSNSADSTKNRTKTTEAELNPTCTDVTSSNQISTDQLKTQPIAIKVTDVHKSFRLPTERASGLKQAIFNSLKGIKGYTEHQVLKGIDFEVHAGEFLGIVGRNGSGKSTLLKILAQIYYPEQGSIEVNGTLVPFIELGVGFNPELTGRENVYLNGALLGFSRAEMSAMYDEIVRFAELEPFMDAKLKNYSSGMQVRLAFSIAIRAKGDILILDEVLAVGDAEFQQKCNDYFASLHGSQTVILVTHSMDNVRRFCDRAILIEDGKIATEGSPEDVAKAYEGLWS